MAYRFKSTESIPQNIRRIVAEQIESAISHLRGNENERELAIHEARKSMKRVRAVLRLVRKELGPHYRKENAELRNIGKQLSALRDAGVLVQTFDTVLNSSRNGEAAPGLDGLRKQLEQSKHQAELSSETPTILGEAAASLEKFAGRVDLWPMPSNLNFIDRGFRRIYKAGRKVMHESATRNDSELWHEWRKRAKDHLFHIRLFENVWTDELKQHESCLHELESVLGDDHNLLVLREHLRADHKGISKDELKRLDEMLREDRKRLREKASSLGKIAYQKKSAEFSKEVTGLAEELFKIAKPAKKAHGAKKKAAA